MWQKKMKNSKKWKMKFSKNEKWKFQKKKNKKFKKWKMKISKNGENRKLISVLLLIFFDKMFSKCKVGLMSRVLLV